jgi:glycerophosphoryl diester phosphodiesterase
MSDTFKVIAHRGASAYAPDNTAAAFELAIEQGAPLVETDVQMTADGVLVLEHDWRVASRLTPALTLAELSALRPGLLTVAAALEQFGSRIPFCWEVKQPGIETALVTMIHDQTTPAVWAQTEFTSFFPSAAVQCRQLAPENRVGWLTRDYDTSAIDAVAAAGLTQFCPPAQRIIEDPALVEYAHSKGLLVRAWQTQDPAWTPQLAALGVYGATVNWPDQALAALQGAFQNGGDCAGLPPDGKNVRLPGAAGST